MFEPKNVKEALTDEAWIEAMQEELNQFERSEVWDLVPRLEDVNITIIALVLSYQQTPRLQFIT